MPDPYFFLSYSRVDGLSYVERFYQDLIAKVRQKAGLSVDVPSDHLGFFDRDIELGQRWTRALDGGLRRSQILLCLLSRGYFNSEACGKELEGFRLRLGSAGAGSDSGTGRIVPLLWGDGQARLSNHMPRVVAELQHDHVSLPAIYRDEGLLHMLEIFDDYEGDYRRVLTALAKSIVDTVDRSALPPGPEIPDFQSISNAFEPQSAPEGPGSLRFLVVAPSRAESSEVRTRFDPYGDDWARRDWRPNPDSERPETIGALVNRAARGFDIEPLPVGDDTLPAIRAAKQRNGPVLILLDPWALRIERYVQLLREIDEGDFFNAGIVVVWGQDAETRRHADALRREVHHALPRTFERRQVHVRDSSSEPTELEREVASCLHKVDALLRRRAIPTRPVEGDAIPQVNAA